MRYHIPLLAILLAAGCDNTDMAPTTPEPEARAAATPTPGGGGAGLSVMGAVAPAVQGCSSRASWRTAHHQASQRYWKSAFHTGADYTPGGDDDIYWHKRAKGCKGNAQLAHDCRTATLTCFGEWNVKTTRRSGFTLTINFKPEGCGSDGLACVAE